MFLVEPRTTSSVKTRASLVDCDPGLFVGGSLRGKFHDKFTFGQANCNTVSLFEEEVPLTKCGGDCV